MSERGFSWAVSIGVLSLLVYLLSSGPVCRYSWRTARKVYAPLNWLANSKAGRPVFQEWVSMWGAVPWWNQKPAAAAGPLGGVFPAVVSGYFELHAVSTGVKVVPATNGMPQNQDLAPLRRAAEAGDAQAQFQLGACLYDGKHGVPASPAEAYKWTLLAVTNGVREATYLAGEMAIFLTAEQLKEGRSAAATFASGKASD